MTKRKTRWTLETLDSRTAVLRFADGFDKVVIRAVCDPAIVEATPREMQGLFGLIAAAPAMRDALKELLKDPYLSEPLNKTRMCKARAAIALLKARH